MPIVTFVLVALNILVYLLEQALGGESFCQIHGLIPAQFMRTGEMSPVFEAMFLHANLTHLVGNLVFLTFFGAVVEAELGGIWLTAVYFAAGLAGALLHVSVDPTSTSAMVGCSGCVFGLIALVAARNPRFLGFAIAFGAVEIWHALASNETTVSFGAHLGGLATGAIFAALLRATDLKEERYA